MSWGAWSLEFREVEKDGTRSVWMRLGLMVTRYGDATRIASRLTAEGFELRVVEHTGTVPKRWRRSLAASLSNIFRHTATIS